MRCDVFSHFLDKNIYKNKFKHEVNTFNTVLNLLPEVSTLPRLVVMSRVKQEIKFYQFVT